MYLDLVSAVCFVQVLRRCDTHSLILFLQTSMCGCLSLSPCAAVYSLKVLIAKCQVGVTLGGGGYWGSHYQFICFEEVVN